MIVRVRAVAVGTSFRSIDIFPSEKQTPLPSFERVFDHGSIAGNAGKTAGGAVLGTDSRARNTKALHARSRSSRVSGIW
jgi:hypothetical protein